MKLVTTIVLAVLLGAAAPAAALIQGSSTASNCGEGGNWLDITFTSDEGVYLVDIWWDFNPTDVWLDADGSSVCSPINNGVSSYAFYFDGPVGVDTQDWGMTATGFGSGDYFRIQLDLDRAGSGNMPYGPDLMGGIVTVEFSDGTILHATFDTLFDGTEGATANFDNLPALPNFEFTERGGWAAPLVPRLTDDSTSNSVPAPVYLVGESESTYLNVTVQNTGEVISPQVPMNIYLDGTYLHGGNLLMMFPDARYGWINQGPYTVPGGRHVLRVTADPFGACTESDETDNDWAMQYCWRGPDLAPLSTLTRAAPPLYNQDHTYFTASYWNCDGVRVTPSPSYDWVAVWSEQLSDVSNNLLRLHPAMDDAYDSFGTAYGNSRYGSDLQALLVNTHTFGEGPWDVSVIRTSFTPDDYRIAHLHESPYPFDFGIEPETPYFVQRLAMFQFHVGTGDLGEATLTLYSDPDDGPVHMGWLAPDFTHGNLDDLIDPVVTDAEGLARIDLNLTVTGEYCAVVYGNRAEHPTSLAVNVGLYKPRPDLETHTMMGWHAPIVPQPHGSSTLFNCPLPDTLHGGTPTTRMNLATINRGLALADFLTFAIDIDGTFNLGLSQGTDLGPGDTRVLQNIERVGTPWSIRGGRHTLGLRLDYSDLLDESVERNNESGRQYCWSPLALTPNEGVTFNDPDILPDRTGGHDLCDGTETLYPNCDGLRLSGMAPVGGDGWWRAVAVVPLAINADIGLELHEVLVGTQDGFGPNPLATSNAGNGDIDFIMVSDRFVKAEDLDVGVLADVNNLSPGYRVQDARSFWRGSVKSLDGSYTMPSGRMIDLHEYQLSPGTWLFTLTDDSSPGVDWGMSIYTGTGHHGREEAVEDGIVWLEPMGGTERMLVTVPTVGYYCLAVWKTGILEVSKEGDYSIWMSHNVSGVPEPEPEPELPAVSRLVGAAPNPFNPRTTIAFELAQDGYCTLDVYDLQGRRVRTLVAEHRRAGRGEAVWNGLDDRGRRAASGVYLARFQAAGVNDLVKVTLVK